MLGPLECLTDSRQDHDVTRVFSPHMGQCSFDYIHGSEIVHLKLIVNEIQGLL